MESIRQLCVSFNYDNILYSFSFEPGGARGEIGKKLEHIGKKSEGEGTVGAACGT